MKLERQLQLRGYSLRQIGYLIGGLSRQAVQQRLQKPTRIKVKHIPSKSNITVDDFWPTVKRLAEDRVRDGGKAINGGA